MRPLRASAVAPLLALSLVLLTHGSALSQVPPNVILLQADDWGWPYFGFMQRYIAAKITGTCEGGANAGQPCQTNGECPGSFCDSDLVGDDPFKKGAEYMDTQILLPDISDPGRPPLDQLMTPALDSLAAAGNFWPLAHNSASRSEPALAVTMTGLIIQDYVIEPVSRKSTSPVLPEFLPSAYLTMACGKWEFEGSHINSSDFSLKTPWDREIPHGMGAGEDSRALLVPYAQGDPQQQALQGLALEALKDFVACARCTDTTKCGPPPVGNREEDSARLAARTNPALCGAQPFFILFNTFVPHVGYRFNNFCPYYPRDAAQCDTEPWKTHSVYCNHPTGFDWSCANYAAAIEAALADPRVPRRKIEYVKFANIYDRAVDEILVHLKCPAGGTPDCGEDLASNTVLIFRSDHGWELRKSKAAFTEHAYRTPTILFDPRPENRLPDSTEGCGGQPGCRTDFAHAVDVLPTLKDLSGSTFTCDDTCAPCDPECTNACPCDRPDGQSRYSEGHNLRQPIARSCGTADPSYRQCLFGRKKGNQGLLAVVGWYVLAEIANDPDVSRLCKLYKTNSGRPLLFDLNEDPNEKRSLDRATEAGTFCGSRKSQLISVLRDAITARGWYDPRFENGLD